MLDCVFLLKMAIKIFIGEHESYKPLVRNAFLKHLEKNQFWITIRDSVNEIPKNYDIYLLHVSHYPLEQIEELREESPHCVIMLRCQTADLVPYPFSREGKSLEVDGFYTPSITARGLEEDLPKICLNKLGLAV